MHVCMKGSVRAAHAKAWTRIVRLSSVLLFVAVYGAASAALACGDGQTELYRSEKSVWCVDNGLVAEYGAFPETLFPFGDQVIDELVAVFHVEGKGVYTYEAGPVTGYAHTGSECCGLGVTVTGDA